MKRINPLQTNQQVLRMLCVCPFAKETSPWTKVLCISFTAFIFMSNLCGIIASITFFTKFVSSDLELSLHALLQIAALTAAIYMNANALFSRNKINTIFQKLETIYESSNNLVNKVNILTLTIGSDQGSKGSHYHLLRLFNYSFSLFFEHLEIKPFRNSRTYDIDTVFWKIYDSNVLSDSNAELFHFMEIANTRSERISKKYLKFVLVGFFLSTLIMSMVSLLYCWILNGAFDTKYVYHSFQVS